MTIEAATYISSLNASYPASGDPKSEGDDHIRLVKSTVKATFPNVSGAVTPTHTELNYVDGVTSAIQTQLDAKAALASPALTGTPTAPTATAGDNTTQIATTEFVTSASFASALPAQAGNSGKFVTTDGTNASWAYPVATGTGTGSYTTPSRAFATTYTNSGSTTRWVSVSGYTNGTFTPEMQVLVDGAAYTKQQLYNASASYYVYAGLTFPVAAGSTYRVNASGGTWTLDTWKEYQ